MPKVLMWPCGLLDYEKDVVLFPVSHLRTDWNHWDTILGNKYFTQEVNSLSPTHILVQSLYF